MEAKNPTSTTEQHYAVIVSAEKLAVLLVNLEFIVDEKRTTVEKCKELRGDCTGMLHSAEAVLAFAALEKNYTFACEDLKQMEIVLSQAKNLHNID